MSRSYRPKNMNNVEMSAWMRTQCIIDGNGCWVWQGFISKKGYGQVGWETKSYPVHRLYWDLIGLVIPDGHELWHNIGCSKACFNPDHLEIGTRLTNKKLTD